MEKVFDVHIHYTHDISLDRMIEIFKKEFAETKTEKGCFLSIPHENSATDNAVRYAETQNIKGLYLKRAFAPDFYAFAGLVHPQTHTDEKAISKDFLRQVEEYFSVGYDGMKMLEGYPSLLKGWGVPLDSKIYDEYYSFMEENGYPIIMHIANPNENWDISKADAYAIKVGRVYDSSFPTKDEITAQTFGIMKKFPKLKLILAHCGFFSQEKENAERFLGDYENTALDITPGGEQLINMGKEWDYWLPFIEKYQDRFFYGTDFYAFPDDDEERWKISFWRRPRLIRQFFETDTAHDYAGTPFCGIKLDEKLRKKIYWDNAERLLGKPKKIDENYMLTEAKRLLKLPNNSMQCAETDLRYIIAKLEEKRN